MNKLYETLQSIYELPEDLSQEPSEFIPVVMESELLLNFWHRIKLAFWLLTGKHLHALTDCEISNVGVRFAETIIAPPEYFNHEEDY